MNKVITFILGAALGGTASYFITKKLIEKRIDGEVESVVDMYEERLKNIKEVLTDEQKDQLNIPYKNDDTEVKNDEEVKNNTDKEYNKITKNKKEVYVDKVSELNYAKKEDLNNRDPYVLTDDEFGEFGNEEVTLIYYNDGILATEDDEPIEDPTELLGNCLDMFDPYESMIYIRNQEKEIDYVILRSEKDWADISPIVTEEEE